MNPLPEELAFHFTTWHCSCHLLHYCTCSTVDRKWSCLYSFKLIWDYVRPWGWAAKVYTSLFLHCIVYIWINQEDVQYSTWLGDSGWHTFAFICSVCILYSHLPIVSKCQLFSLSLFLFAHAVSLAVSHTYGNTKALFLCLSLSFSLCLSLSPHGWLFQAHAQSALTDCLNVTPVSSSLWCYLHWVIAGHQAACVRLGGQSSNALQLVALLKTNTYMNHLTSFLCTWTQEIRLVTKKKKPS